ncbi:hypothetical protein ACFWIB_12070 [Streptomyces sp. NPDC127051]|uniref:hypothetical protein n=1 Tax=Streptomyces sp. NPDC127051 TaxID=3347119 RepID=UPI00366A3D78
MAISLLSTDSPLGIPAEAFTVTADRYGTAAAPQRRFVREIDPVSDAPTAVLELDSSHSPFLAQPAALATAIAGLYRRV